MATRSKIQLNYGVSKIELYRHWDGYLAEGGRELSILLNHYKTSADLIKGLINRQREIHVYDIDAPLYEIAWHPDMGEEYRYIINLPTFADDKNTSLSVEVLHAPYGKEWKSIYKKTGKPEEVKKDFLKLCDDEYWKLKRRAG